jgi:hypothetical protein
LKEWLIESLGDPSSRNKEDGSHGLRFADEMFPMKDLLGMGRIADLANITPTSTVLSNKLGHNTARPKCTIGNILSLYGLLWLLTCTYPLTTY